LALQDLPLFVRILGMQASVATITVTSMAGESPVYE